MKYAMAFSVDAAISHTNTHADIYVYILGIYSSSAAATDIIVVVILVIIIDDEYDCYYYY